MRKLFSLFVAFVATTLWAYGFQLGDLYYTITSNSAPYTVEVSDAVSSITFAVIPSTVTYNGTTYSVTRIGNRAFCNCSSLTSITIPNSVTEIGEYAFANCSFTSFTIPSQITHIARWAFANCSLLTSIIWNIPRMDFDYSEHVPFGGVESYITSFTFGEEVEIIPEWLCRNMKNLTSITLPNTVTSIGMHTFRDCSSLQSITITAQSLEEYCNGRGNEMLCIINSSYGLGEINNDIKRNLLVNGIETKEIIIPTNIKSIGNYAFCGCSDLISINMHDSITNIGMHAFDGCSSLTAITIPNNVASIGDCLFTNCSSLKSIIWNANNCTDFYVAENAPFYDIRSQITSFTFGKDVEHIPAYLCYGMKNIPSLALPSNVKKIGTSAFEDSNINKSLIIPNTVTNVGKNAFRNCSSIESVIIGKSVASIGENAFANCNSIKSVTWNAKHCSSFGICYIGYIDGELFQIFDSSPFTTNVSTFSFGNEVEYIPSCLCLGMKNLTSITIPNSVTSIGSGAFYGCTALTSVNIPQKVNSIDMMAFAGCPSRSSITVASDNSTYDSRNNCNAIIEKATNTLITGCKNTTIPNDVLHIGDYAFYGGGSSLTSMTISANVETIGEFAFGECPRLYDIYCYAAVPPIAKLSSFSNYNAFVHVPCESQRYYVLDDIWSKFKNYECITSDNVTTDGIYITPSTNDVTIIWPIEIGADSYTIVIMKETEVVCTLTFNADGQLLNIAFAPSRDGSRPAQHTQYAEQTTDGYRFTVTGLEAATHYTYDITVKDIANNTIKTHSGEFTTKSMTAIENISTNDANIQKIMRNGQLYILQDGNTYNIMGQKIGNL